MENIKIIAGDAVEELAKLLPGSVDAVITDPPYASGGFTEAAKSQASKMGVRGGEWFQGDNLTSTGIGFLLRAVALVALPALRGSGHLLFFTDWRMVPVMTPAVESAGVRYTCLLVWDKRFPGLGTGFRPQHELIMHFTAGTPEYYALDGRNVLTAGRVNSTARRHPTEKPVALLEELIRVTVPPGGVVVDPFAGSGTTGIAALNIGRQAILIERSRGFCDVAERRMAQELQTVLPLSDTPEAP